MDPQLETLPASDEEDDELDAWSDEEPDDEMEIKGILEMPERITCTTKRLHSQIHEGEIDLNPQWQRDVVWNEPKMSQLIDSLYRNFQVPPVVFWRTIDDGQEILICVDGKQRLTSIQRFFDGQVPYRDPRTKKKWYYTAPRGDSKLVISNKWKKAFSEKEISCVIYKNLEPGVERQIFQRVQLGMHLTSAERLRAIASPLSSWINELNNKFIHIEGGLRDYLDFTIKRSQDFLGLAYLLYSCENAKDRPLISESRLNAYLDTEREPDSEFKEEIQDTLRNFCVLATKYRSTFSKIPHRVAPLEFVFIGVLLYHTSDLSHEMQSKASYNLRHAIRENFQAVRINSDTVAAAWNFIDQLLRNPSSLPKYHAPPGKGRKAAVGRKRKKFGDDDDDDNDGDYKASNVKRGGKGRR